MTVAFVQKTTTFFSDGPTSASFSITGVTAGNLLVLTVSEADSGTTGVAIPTPSGWSVAEAPTGPGHAGGYGSKTAIFYKQNAASGSHTASWSGMTTDAYFAANITEVSGASTTAALGVHNNSVGTSSSNGDTVSTSATTVADAVVFAVACTYGVTDLSAPPSSGYTLIGNDPGNGDHVDYSAGYKVLSATGTQSATWTWTGTDGRCDTIAVFYADVAAGGISPTGIGSAEALGTPALAATVAPVGIASAQALGAPSIGASVAPAAISSGEALGAPSLSASVSPAGIASAEAAGTPSIGASITPIGIASGEAFGVPVVAPSGVLPVGIASAEAFGQPALAAVINAVAIGSQEAVGVPMVGAAPPPPVTTFPGFEVDQRRRRLPERSVKPMLVRAMERRLQNVKPPKERAAVRAKAIEFQAAALVLDGATQREIAPLLQQWEAQRPYIPPQLADVPTLDVFLSQVGFRIEQAQAQKAALEAIATARRQDEDALLALLLA